METKTFSIPAISCMHCTSAVENELREMAGILSVKGDVQTKTILVEWEKPATMEKIVNTLKEMNYPPAL